MVRYISHQHQLVRQPLKDRWIRLQFQRNQSMFLLSHKDLGLQPASCASEFASLGFSHEKFSVSVMPSVPEEDYFGADSSHGECDVSVVPSVPEQEDNFP
ncbi:hypothetical protein MRX96_057368 [Rhipicephalus microplus]